MTRNYTLHRIVYTALMAALIFVLLTFLTFPFMGTKIHPSNAADMLAGLLLGPWYGGLAAGIGNALYDLTHGYGLESLVTFAMKFLSAMLVGLISRAYRREGPMLKSRDHLRVVLACVVSGVVYVALYMLKTFIKQHFIGGVPLDGTWVAMGQKLPGSLINNGFAIVVAPLFYTALRPALNAIGVIDQLRPRKN